MALTEAQINDSIFLANMISQLNNQRNNIINQKESALRQNEMQKQQDILKLRQLNQRNGVNGGFEESNYARLLARAGQGAADINSQYGTMLNDNSAQIAEYQAYLDAYNQRMAELAAAAAAGYGGGGRRTTSTEPLNITPMQNNLSTVDRAVSSNTNRVPYTAGGYTSTSLPLRNVEMTDTGTSARNSNSLMSSVGSTVKSAAKKSNNRYVK